MVSDSYWHSRGYMPHLESGLLLQHVTYHLADSLPHDVVARLNVELHDVIPEHMDAERRRWLEAWIDAGHGSCVLREPSIAELVQEVFWHHNGERYQLLAWVVMPNHVHVLIR
ncbi:MAG: transposase, partial [bacterium]|nr:transposase [bacterium]